MKSHFGLNKIALLIGLIGSSLWSYGQYNETIRTGRPGQSIGPFTVGKSVFQNQSGIQFNGARRAGSSLGETQFVSVFRAGLTERFEVGGSINYRDSERESVGDIARRSGVDAVTLRMRSNVYVGKGWIPSFGYQLHIGLPIVSKDFNQRDLYPKLTLMTGQRLSNRIAFTTNSGLNWNGFSTTPVLFYTLNFNIRLLQHGGIILEHYNTLANNSWTPRGDVGLYYRLTNDIQLDVNAGYFASNDVWSEYFVATGISWRFRWKKPQVTNPIP